MRRGLRFLFCMLLLLSALALPPVLAEEEEDTDRLYQEQLEASGAEALFDSLPDGTRELLDKLGISGLDADSLTALQPGTALSELLAMAGSQSGGVLGSCGLLLGIILLCALMDSLKQTVREPAVSDVFGVICSLAACAAESTSVFMISFVPVYSGILLTSGQALTAASYNTVVLFVAELISLLATKVIVPLMTVSLALGLTGSVSGGLRLEGVGSWINKAAGWLLTITTSLFVGLLSLQGIVGAAADTLAGRAINFSISSFVPVVGGALSEAFNAVKGCLSLLKSTLGGFGILTTVLIAAPPILECVLWSLGLSLCGMAAELFGLSQISTVLKTAQSVVKTLIGVLAACALFMIIATTIVTKAGGGG